MKEFKKKIKIYFDKKMLALGFIKKKKLDKEVIVSYERFIYDTKQTMYINIDKSYGRDRIYCYINANTASFMSYKDDDIFFNANEELDWIIEKYNKIVDEKLLFFDDKFFKTQVTKSINEEIFYNYKEISLKYILTNNTKLNSIFDVRSVAIELLIKFKNEQKYFKHYIIKVTSLYIYYILNKYKGYQIHLYDNIFALSLIKRELNSIDIIETSNLVANFWYYGDDNYLECGKSKYYHNYYKNEVVLIPNIKEKIK